MWFYEKCPRSVHFTDVNAGSNLLYLYHAQIEHFTAWETSKSPMCICTILLHRKIDRSRSITFISESLFLLTARHKA
jgi:hypothetical protein